VNITPQGGEAGQSVSNWTDSAFPMTNVVTLPWQLVVLEVDLFHR